MKLGVYTDGLAGLSPGEVASFCRETLIEVVELGCGNWSTAPHLDLDLMLESQAAREELLGIFAAESIDVGMLNCSGNPLAPGDVGRQHLETIRKTIRLASLIGHDTIVTMSGLPGASARDECPNWIVTSWPPENRERLAYQWSAVAVPVWRELAAYAQSHGVTRIALENHGHQLVYNTSTLLRLREAVGPAIGANLDPSHLLWMGGDPLVALRAMGESVYHLHAKDTVFTSARGPDGLLTARPHGDPDRAWEYEAAGAGHDAEWWEEFLATAAAVGSARMISVEHPEPGGIAEAAARLRAVWR